MAVIITLFNQKGGVAKTTTAVNLGANLAAKNLKVLLVDIDPQSNTTNAVGINDEELKKSISNLFMNYENLQTEDIKSIIQKTDFKMDLLPSDIELAEAEQYMITYKLRELVLNNILEQIKADYDFIIIDCPPSLGLMSINGLSACNYVIIPVTPSAFSVKGIKNLLKTYNSVKRYTNHNIEILGIVLTRCRLNTKGLKDTSSALEDFFGDKLFKTMIRDNIQIDYSQLAQKPITFYDKNCNSSADYLALTEEVLNNVKR